MGKKKIGILGGTFNPIHIGHLRTAEEVKEALDLDQVLFVPSFDPPFTKQCLASFSHRLTMVRLAIGDNPAFSASDVEAKIHGKSYTAHTVQKLIGEYTGCRLFFIIGTDAFVDLPKWYNPEEIIRQVEVIVVLRPLCEIERLMESPFLGSTQTNKLNSLRSRKKVSLIATVSGRRIVFLRTTPLDISSSFIRNQMRKGKSLKYLLPQKVESYIIFNNLYH